MTKNEIKRNEKLNNFCSNVFNFTASGRSETPVEPTTKLSEIHRKIMIGKYALAAVQWLFT